MNNTSMSENVNELFTSLSKAQGKIQPASKDKSNPFFKSKYADLASVKEACREPLSENGLCVIQVPQLKDGQMILMTILGHSSGQWIKGEMPVILAKNDPQSLGSAFTYFRRYMLAAIVGVAPDDDDGEKAQAGFRNQKEEQKPITKKISDVESADLNLILSECSPEYKEYFYKSIKKQFNASSISEIPIEMYERVKTAAFKNMEETHSKQKMSLEQV